MDPILFPSRRFKRGRTSGDTVSGDLFGESVEKPPKHPAYQASSETSKAAAEKIAPKVRAMQLDILTVIVSNLPDGYTRKELEDVTGFLTQTLTPRLLELEQGGYVRKLTRLSIDKRKVETVRRSGCAVYVATARGIAMIREDAA